MTWNPANSQGAESMKIRWDLVPYTRGLGYDIGCGPWKAFKHFVGIDSNKDEGLFGIRATGADLIVPDASDLKRNLPTGEADFVFSSHLLEHIEDHKKALREWWRLIKPGGHLILYLPHKEFYPNIGTPMANPDHKHDFMPRDIIEAMMEVGRDWALLVNEDRNADDEYSFFQVYQKLPPEVKGPIEPWKLPKPKKTCAIIRYGAYGDVLQAASVLPALKEQGYHITWYCVDRGYDVLKYDPNIDEFVIQDENQVAQFDLREYFDHLRKKYTKLVNFCEAVEGVLLPDTGKTHYYWPKDARHAICNKNYVEFQHMIAEVPYTKPLTKFHRTAREAEQAKFERRKCDGPVVVWALSGSAPHKIWLEVDVVIARILLEFPNTTVVLVGGESEQFCEQGWQNEKRVWKRSGVWDIRRSMAFAQEADLVVGPETGILNAMAMEPMAKVLFLSHSSVENLCRDWVNTAAFAAEGVECYPCHRLHVEGWRYCNRHPDGGAACQVAITADHVWPVVASILTRAGGKKRIVFPEELIAAEERRNPALT